MYGDNNKEFDKLLDHLGYKDLKNFDKLSPQEMEKQLSNMMQKMDGTQSLELNMFISKMMEEDPAMNRHNELLRKSTNG
jgi:hypothetical protein